MRSKVTELGPTDHVEAGETAPDFVRPLVNAEFWEDVALSDLLEEGPLLLVFHPMDGAFPTTYIYNELREREIADEVQIAGLSISTPYEHKTTIEDRGIEHYAGLFADPQNGVAEEYGITHALDGMTGIEEPRPALFLIDEERTVQHVWVAERWPEFPEYDDLEDAIDELST
ncbi:MAG: redoxin domain-containing protein [Halodesulfurarchaeum sp.]